MFIIFEPLSFNLSASNLTGERVKKSLCEKERKNDFDELEEMGKELEKEQEKTIDDLETENKKLKSELHKYRDQLDSVR